ncbi:MAG: hypothetical protein LBK60_10825 [Verrucomicrobiales bacterium]|jgi:hypothetical protein|nr:hypothetical protein [Verrucomicrobiales bacterium]
MNTPALPAVVDNGQKPPKETRYIDRKVINPLVAQNPFIGRAPLTVTAPELSLSAVRDRLPQPFWDGHDAALACYWKVWELACKNCKVASPSAGFVAPFIDTAFNGDLFMWDSVFIMMFARYGERVFPFQKTLDNFYAKQHVDGFICRQISPADGGDRFHYADHDSTGPGLLAWPEWEYYLQFGDRQRLAEVFPPLLAYYQWMRKYRTWPDGTYWATGWACGMDNQPRLSAGARPENDHDHLSWIDTNAQAVLVATLLVNIARELGRDADVRALREEIAALTVTINNTMWHERLGWYVDRRRDGTVSDVKSIAGLWPLLAGLVPPERQARLLAHLTDPATFGRPHPVPSLSADHPLYHPLGQYWRGGVWPPTTYMALRALTLTGHDELAHQLAARHVAMVTEVFNQTGTVWENYAPDSAAPGNIACADMVGWSGLGPIAVLLEYLIGLRPDFTTRTLLWDVRLTEAHGVRNYPFGADITLSLSASARAGEREEPRVTINASRPVKVLVKWPGGTRVVMAGEL